jgi:threonine synthase
MDVQAPSNFERLVYEASGSSPATTKALFDTFGTTGAVTLSPELQSALKAEVTASTISEDKTRETIAHAYKAYGKVICPHTAVALGAALERREPGKPQIFLSTAHAAKFPDFVQKALGFAPEVPEAIQALYGLPERITELKLDQAAALDLVTGFSA